LALKIVVANEVELLILVEKMGVAILLGMQCFDSRLGNSISSRNSVGLGRLDSAIPKELLFSLHSLDLVYFHRHVDIVLRDN
jgi:hypothetical protein